EIRDGKLSPAWSAGAFDLVYSKRPGPEPCGEIRSANHERSKAYDSGEYSDREQPNLHTYRRFRDHGRKCDPIKQWRRFGEESGCSEQRWHGPDGKRSDEPAAFADESRQRTEANARAPGEETSRTGKEEEEEQKPGNCGTIPG